MLFEQQLRQHPDQLALSDTFQERSWKELYDEVLALRHYLLNTQQLKPNQHIALLIGNKLEFFEAMIAGICAGLWVTPINIHLSEQERLYVLNDCDASLLLYDQTHADIVKQNLPCAAVNIESLCQSLPTEFEKIPLDAPSGGTMLYTSGTTGHPKGVRRNKPALLKDALEKMAQAAKPFGLTGAGPHLITGPLYHAAPMMFAFYDMLNGAPVIIMPKWDSEQFFALVNQYQVHTSHLVPTMFVRLLQLNEKQNISLELIKSLKLVLHGAAPIAPSVKQQMINWWGPLLVEYWGASEAGVSTLITSEEWLKHSGSVGKALPHLRVYVGDKQGNPVDDETGLLFCKHETLKQVFEYHKDENKTLKAHPQDFIFCIGDIGRVDAEGYVYLSDRESNMIISGGVNIYPAEIEQALMEYSAISDLAVFGVKDEEWGERVKALIELKDNSQATEHLKQHIIEFAKSKIASYKVPREIEFIERLPRNAAGKIRIKELKQS